MNSRFYKGVILAILTIFLLASTGFQPVHAVDKSRFFIWLLFASGLGSSTAGAIIQGQANETYDMYLHTAVQADMDKHIDDYNRKHQQSVIASRTGIGLVVGAILLSLLDAAYIPPPETPETPTLFGNKSMHSDNHIVSMNVQDGNILFTMGRKF
jgi:hypothetical protein